MIRPAPLLLSFALWSTPGLANADAPPPPDVQACSAIAAGAACQIEGGGSGQCVASKCSKLDYSQGTPPRSVEYDCLRCEQGSPVTPATQPAPPAPGTPTPVAPAAPAPPEVQGRCAVDPGVGSLGALLGLFGLWRRRRR